MPRSSVFVSAVCGAAAWVGLLSLSSSSSLSVSVSVAGQATQQVCDSYWNSVAQCENRSDADGWSDALFRACINSSRVHWPAATYCPGPGLPPNNDRSTWRPPYLAATTTNDRAGEYGVEDQVDIDVESIESIESIESVDTLARCMIECVATESKVVASECRTVKFARRGECHAKAAAKAAATCSNKCAHHAPKATTTTIVAAEASVSDAAFGGACLSKCMNSYLVAMEECKPHANDDEPFAYNVCVSQKQGALIGCNVLCKRDQEEVPEVPEVPEVSEVSEVSPTPTPTPTPIAYYPGACIESCEYADHACRVSSSGSPKSIVFCARKLTECQAKCDDESTQQVASTPIGDSCERGCHASVSDWKQRVWSANQCRSYACFQWLEAQATSVLDVCHKCCDYPYASTHSCQPPPIPHFPGAAAVAAASVAVAVAPAAPKEIASPAINVKCSVECQDKLARCQKAAGVNGVKRAQCIQPYNSCASSCMRMAAAAAASA